MAPFARHASFNDNIPIASLLTCFLVASYHSVSFFFFCFRFSRSIKVVKACFHYFFSFTERDVFNILHWVVPIIYCWSFHFYARAIWSQYLRTVSSPVALIGQYHKSRLWSQCTREAKYIYSIYMYNKASDNTAFKTLSLNFEQFYVWRYGESMGAHPLRGLPFPGLISSLLKQTIFLCRSNMDPF